MLCYCLVMLFVGLIGFWGEPSPSIAGQMGHYAILFYSAIMAAFGLFGAVGIFRNVQATIMSVYAIAAATFFHGVSVWAAGAPQVGLRLAAAPLMMVPLAWVWGQWLRLIKHADRLGLGPINP